MSELKEQIALFKWAERQVDSLKETRLKLMYAIPNGMRTNIVQAALARRSGMKKGCPDICLPVPSGRYHGLYLEMKVGKNTTSKEQNWWLDALSRQGYYCNVAYSCADAIRIIEDYLIGFVECND